MFQHLFHDFSAPSPRHHYIYQHKINFFFNPGELFKGIESINGFDHFVPGSSKDESGQVSDLGIIFYYKNGFAAADDITGAGFSRFTPLPDGNRQINGECGTQSRIGFQD